MKKKHLVIATPYTTGWAVTSVWAPTEEELEQEAKKALAEFILDEFLELGKRYPNLGLREFRDDPAKRDYLLSELFKRARQKEDFGQEYIVYVGTDPMELVVPHPKDSPWNRAPMDEMIRRLMKEIRDILKTYPG